MLAPALSPELPGEEEPPLFGRADGAPAGWAVSPGLVPYPEAVAVYMQGLKTPGALTDPEGRLATDMVRRLRLRNEA